MNEIEFTKEKTACFTGHRPEKLPDKGDRNSTATKIIKSMIYAQIQNAIDDGYDTFIVGMQRGVDLWAGEAVLSVMPKAPVSLVSVLPFKDFGSNFKNADRWTFERVLEASRAVVTVCGSYTKDCMRQRNRYMVEHSSRIIGVCDNMRSGTGQTLGYARKMGLDMHIIRIDELFGSSVSKAAETEEITFDSLENPPQNAAVIIDEKYKYTCDDTLTLL